jgi:hypothetical protein
MDLQLEAYEALCELNVFLINGVQAIYEDFGSKGDETPEEAEPYGCGDMRFTSKEATAEILKKYGITEAEYSTVCEQLASKLSFGSCCWCV